MHLDKFKFNPGLDILNGDIKRLNSNTPENLAREALLTTGCLAFNTLGYLKNKVGPLTKSRYFGKNDGLYILEKVDRDEVAKDDSLSTPKPRETTNDNCPDGYVYLPHLDQMGFDLKFSNGNVSEVARHCNNLKEGVAFNSAGYLKRMVTNLVTPPIFRENGGLYFKKAAFSRLEECEGIVTSLYTRYSMEDLLTFAKRLGSEKTIICLVDKDRNMSSTILPAHHNITFHLANDLINPYWSQKGADQVLDAVNVRDSKGEHHLIFWYVPIDTHVSEGLLLNSQVIPVDRFKLRLNKTPKICSLSHREHSTSKSLLDDLLKLEGTNYMEHFVTPYTGYLLCDHFIGSEIHKGNIKHVDIPFHFEVKGNDLLKNQNYWTITEGDIVYVQQEYFDLFVKDLLPNLQVKIILFTGQYHYPQITRSALTRDCLDNENIILWVSQNPIYRHNKYMAFPYGFSVVTLAKFVDYLRKVRVGNTSERPINLYNSPSRVHPHLKADHIRRKYPLIFGARSGKLPFNDYLDHVSKSKLVISTTGDRDDCHRHYECIGLGAKPVSNIGTEYYDIFGENMIYLSETEMVDLIKNNEYESKQVLPNSAGSLWNDPNRDIILVKYWVQRLQSRIDEIKKS